MVRFVACLLLLLLGACDNNGPPPAHLSIARADPERGRGLIAQYGCAACHTIEGVEGPKGTVGPPLVDYAQRSLLAGVMPNVPRLLVPWIVNPPGLVPNTGMPNLGVTEPQARDIAAYLYTLGAREVAVYPPPPRSPLADPEALRGARELDAQRLSGREGGVPIERAMEQVAQSER